MNHTKSADLGMAKREADRLTEVYSSPPIPVLEIAEESGIKVRFVDFGPYSTKVSGYCDFTKQEIFVNGKDIPQRQSFTIAHELGHWFMHRRIFLENPDIYPVLLRTNNPDSNNPLEKEANAFAAHLLVPNRLLKPVQNQGVNAAVLANIFFVSRSMMEIRMRGR